MKQFKIFLLFLFISLSATASNTDEDMKAVYVAKAGTLISEFTKHEANALTHLKISGKINAIDFKNLRDDFTNLEVLDLSSAEIKNYVGKKGTLDQFHVYHANAIPPHAFSEKTNYAPKERTALQLVVLPPTLNSIENFAFANCPNLEILICRGGEAPKLADNALSAKRTVIFVPAGCKENYSSKKVWSDFSIIDSEPLKVEINLEKEDDLADALLSQGYQPKNVHFLTIAGALDADDLQIIRDYMSDLVFLDISNTNTTEIPDYTFTHKSNLLKIHLPVQLKSIGVHAFDSCVNLGPELSLPTTLTTIGAGAFINCHSLNSVHVTGNALSVIGDQIFGTTDNSRLIYDNR